MAREKLTIREWRPTDEGALSRLNRAIFEHHELMGIIVPREHHKQHFSFVAVGKNDEAVGFASVMCRTEREEPHLEGALHPVYENTRILWKLIKAAVQKAKAHGVKAIYVQTLKTQQPRAKNLKTLGFKLHETTEQYHIYQLE